MSIGGRSTLISSVLGSLGNYFLSIFRLPKYVNKTLESLRASFFWGGSLVKRKVHWLKWGSVLAGKEDGGIGIGSLNAMNMALLYKWRWRGLINHDNLWVRVVSDIHGRDCFYNMSAKSKGLWKNITVAAKHIHEIHSLPRDVISRKIGNGQNTRFWKDIWCSDFPFEDRFPRLFALELDKECMVYDRRPSSSWIWNWRREIRSGSEYEQLTDMLQLLPNETADGDDKWMWNLDGKSHFSVACIRRFIDHKSLPISALQTRWNKRVPKKINLFVWRLLSNGIPTHVNLFGRGVDINTVRCNLCANGFDDISHIFHRCSFMCVTRSKLSDWVHFDIPIADPIGMVDWYKDLQLTNFQRDILEAILFIWWWHIWKERNNALYNGSHVSTSDTFNSIVSLSFLWISNRDRKRNFCWSEWIVNPLDAG